jgi:hypothetical protein
MGPITYSADFYVKIYHRCHALNCNLSCYLLKNNGKLQHVKLYLNIQYATCDGIEVAGWTPMGRALAPTKPYQAELPLHMSSAKLRHVART